MRKRPVQKTIFSIILLSFLVALQTCTVQAAFTDKKTAIVVAQDTDTIDTFDPTEDPQDTVQTIAWLKGNMLMMQTSLDNLLQAIEQVRRKTTPLLSHKTKQTAVLETFVSDTLNQAMNIYHSSADTFRRVTDFMSQSPTVLPPSPLFKEIDESQDNVKRASNSLLLLIQHLENA